MFSGIVDHVGQVSELNRSVHSLRLKIASQFNALSLGESIAVDGVCLTLTSVENQVFSVDIAAESLSLTNLGDLQVGRSLNLERSLRLNDLLGGHMVMGHVDQVALVTSIREIDGAHEVLVAGVKSKFMPYLIPKGSISLNGVSLTLNEITADGFKLMLIPHSLSVTNLKDLHEASRVNLEFDIFAKTVFKQLSFLRGAYE